MPANPFLCRFQTRERYPQLFKNRYDLRRGSRPIFLESAPL